MEVGRSHTSRVGHKRGRNMQHEKAPTSSEMRAQSLLRSGCRAKESNLASQRPRGYSPQCVPALTTYARVFGSGHTDTAFRQRCRNARRTAPPTSSAYGLACRPQRKERGTIPQGLAPRRASNSVPSPTIGLPFRDTADGEGVEPPRPVKGSPVFKTSSVTYLIDHPSERHQRDSNPRICPVPLQAHSFFR